MSNMNRKEILDLLKTKYLDLRAAEKAEVYDKDLVVKKEIALEVNVEFILRSTGWINEEEI